MNLWWHVYVPFKELIHLYLSWPGAVKTDCTVMRESKYDVFGFFFCSYQCVSSVRVTVITFNLVLISFWDVIFNQGKPAKHTHRSTLWLFLVENSFCKMEHIHNLIVSIKQSKNQSYKLRWEFRSCCLGEVVFLLEEASHLLLSFTFRICNLESSRRQFSNFTVYLLYSVSMIMP